jgi:hypothetical protein
MTESTSWRRLLPPPRRRPGLLAVLVRWRVEVLLAGLAGAVWRLGGGRGVVLLVVAPMLLCVLVPAVRGHPVSAWQLVAVPHRVRAAFVQAGVATRRGHLPWVFGARPAGDAVRVAVGLRSGITTADLVDAVPVIISACGAASVEIVPRPGRPDRATVVVVRPRRGIL